MQVSRCPGRASQHAFLPIPVNWWILGGLSAFQDCIIMHLACFMLFFTTKADRNFMQCLISISVWPYFSYLRECSNQVKTFTVLLLFLDFTLKGEMTHNLCVLWYGFTCDIWTTMKTLIQVLSCHRRLCLVIYVYTYAYIRTATIHEEIEIWKRGRTGISLGLEVGKESM